MQEIRVRVGHTRTPAASWGEMVEGTGVHWEIRAGVNNRGTFGLARGRTAREMKLSGQGLWDRCR